MPETAIYDPSCGSPQPAAPLSDSARGPIWTGLAVMALFFGGFGGWAAYAPLNGAVVAPAVIKVDGNRKTIQHLDGGIVRELRVREGGRVETGQTVVLLDDTQARAAVTMLSQQHDAYRAQQARLVAERDILPAISFPTDLLARRREAEVAAILATEEKQFEIRRTGLQGQVSVLKQRTQQLEEQIRAAQAQEASQKEQLALIREQLKDQRYLMERGLTQRPRVLELERTAAAITGQAGEIAGNIAKARQGIGEVELQIVQASNDRMTEIAKDLRETQDKLLDLPPKLQAAGDVLNRTELRTPYSGYVVGLSVFSVGGVIGKGEKIMDIVPTRNELTVEASVNVDDVHEVRPGMRAEVQFPALKQRVMPTIHGEVTHVSADRLTEAKTGVPYYTALVRVAESEIAEAKTTKELDLQPGMSATVMIPTRERTALDYLLGPVLASFDYGESRIIGAALPTGAGARPAADRSLQGRECAGRPGRRRCARIPLSPRLELSRIAGTIGPQTLDMRLPERNLPAEVQPIVHAVNGALERLDRAAAAQREFLRRAAHQLRTPLTVLSARAETLDDSETASQLRGDIREIAGMIAQLLQLNELDALPERGNSAADLGAVGEAVCEELQPKAARGDRRIELVQPDRPVLVRGDPNVIEVAVRNLVENAIRHSPPGGAVDIRVRPAGRLEVANAGPAIPEDLQARIFEPFWSGDPDGGHPGLGLTIAAVSPSAPVPR